MGNNKEEQIKHKFGLLLFHLADAGFTYEYIEHRIIHDPFFLFLERNDADAFLEKPLEDIIDEVFHKRVYIDYGKPIASEIYWAGEMYISLLLNNKTPLQRSILAIPVLKMLSLFSPYHEMNEAKLISRYQEEEGKASLLRLLLVDKAKNDISVRQLSLLLGITERTLRSYYDNNRLFAASFEAISRLASYFSVPLCLFTKETEYCPDVEGLLRDESFSAVFASIIARYMSLDPASLSLLSVFDEKKTERLLKVGKKVLDCSRSCLYKSRKNIYCFKPEEWRLLLKLAISEFQKTLPPQTVLF